MIPYYRETIECFSYRTKCRIGQFFYTYFPVIPRRLYICRITKIEISEKDIEYWFTGRAVDNPSDTLMPIQSVSENYFDSFLFKTEEDALEALKTFIKEDSFSKEDDYRIDEKTGHWFQK